MFIIVPRCVDLPKGGSTGTFYLSTAHSPGGVLQLGHE